MCSGTAEDAPFLCVGGYQIFARDGIGSARQQRAGHEATTGTLCRSSRIADNGAGTMNNYRLREISSPPKTSRAATICMRHEPCSVITIVGSGNRWRRRRDGLGPGSDVEAIDPSVRCDRPADLDRDLHAGSFVLYTAPRGFSGACTSVVREKHRWVRYYTGTLQSSVMQSCRTTIRGSFARYGYHSNVYPDVSSCLLIAEAQKLRSATHGEDRNTQRPMAPA